MKIIPDNEAYLIKAPLQIDEAHQLDFANELAQRTYFQSLPKIAFMKITYNRENGILYFNRNIEEIRSYNYLMYKNKNYGNKWFYAFITDMKYENNTTTAIQFVTDVFQTYMFDYSWRNSFIERETVDDDTLGKHLYPEGLEYGDYVGSGTFKSVVTVNMSTASSSSPMLVVQCSERVGHPLSDIDEGRVVGGVPQGSWYYCWYLTTTNYAIVSDFKKYLDSIGKGSAIMNMFLVPASVADWDSVRIHLYDKDGSYADKYMDCWMPQNSSGAKVLFENYEITALSSYGSYTPVNKKLLVWPYQYLMVTNNSGSGTSYHYEDFVNGAKFYSIGSLSYSPSFVLMPQGYKKGYDFDNCLAGTAMPTLSWENDFYLNWIAQNGRQMILDTEQKFVNFAIDTATTAAAVGGANPEIAYGVKNLWSAGVGEGIMSIPRLGRDIGYEMSSTGASANVVQNLVNLGFDIAKKQEQITQAKAVPNSVQGNASGGDLIFANHKIGFTFTKFHIREQYARIIDDYFSKFGYRVNEHKIPNLTSRTNWNYIKTVGANLIPNGVPQEALQELKAIFNNGVTIWHNPSNFLNYSASNTIIR